jgi:hypothetical protein
MFKLRIILLLVFFLACFQHVNSQEITTDSIRERVYVPFVRERYFGSPGPFSLSETICRPDGLLSKKFNLSDRIAIGFGTGVKSSSLVDGCVVLQIELGVDHGGDGGRQCTQPFARLLVNIIFD